MNTEVEVLVIGSGFGGSVAAKRIAEAGRDVLMLERGPWRDTVPNRSMGIKDLVSLPQGAKAFTHGIRSFSSHLFKRDMVLNKKGFIEAYFGDGISIVCSSNVGGGSHVYAGFLDKPLAPNYWDNHHPEISQAGMERYYNEILEALDARALTPQDQVPNRIEEANYNGLLTCLGNPPVAMLIPKRPGFPSKVVDRNGIERWECDMKNNSFLGSPSGAKTTLDFSFIRPAMQQGLIVRDMCEALSIRRLAQQGHGEMRYEVRYRDHRSGKEESVQAEHVILAAGGLGTVRLLLKSRDVEKGLAGMPRLGLEFGGNGDFFGVWKENSKSDLSKGMPIASPFRLKDSKNKRVIVLRASIQGLDDVPAPSFIKRWLRKQSVIIAFGGDNNNGTMEIKRGRLKIKYKSKDNDIYGEIDDELKNIQTITQTKVYAPRNPVTVHPIGGACLGTSNADGVVGANGEVFDNPGLYVADASALPMSPGGAPSLTIAAWSANVADRLIAELENRGAPSEDRRTVLKAT
ncbi:GMC family oxidoreductase [Trinickia terrae]|uniref:Cholesterol oxidase n=1 Tax=Trinickia terrae TaxID=2571161 RepID=A0A4V5PLH8_9BURK|nr:GMC oxidoreductase [Trinickia terrae]TKC92240.1 GMC family oxidoreductase [Trinickia terrae]